MSPHNINIFKKHTALEKNAVSWYIFYSRYSLKEVFNMKFTYRPKGTCSQFMELEVENNTLVSLEVLGGCSGNLQGISKLVQGMDIDEVIDRLEGIRCGFKATSCPDQLAQALRKYKAEAKEA